MRWTAATVEDAERVRIEAAKASDDFLPSKERRSRVEAMLVTSETVAVDVTATREELALELEKPGAVAIAPGAVVYYLGDCEARVVGLGRGEDTLALAFYDELGGLSYTEVPAALCKPAPAELRDGVLVGEDKATEEATRE